MQVIINASAVLFTIIILCYCFVCTAKPRAADPSFMYDERPGSWGGRLCKRLTPRNFFRLVMQRDVLSKEIAAREMPPGAQVRPSRLPRELFHVLEEPLEEPDESEHHVAEDAERQRLSRQTERTTISRQVGGGACESGWRGGRAVAACRVHRVLAVSAR